MGFLLYDRIRSREIDGDTTGIARVQRRLRLNVPTMPTKNPEFIYSDEERRNLVAQLNLFCPDHGQWAETNARKSHVDCFGDAIEEGDTYYKRSAGMAYTDVMKLSAKSMDRLVFCLSSSNYKFERLAKILHEKKTKLDQDAIEEKRLPIVAVRTQHRRVWKRQRNKKE